MSDAIEVLKKERLLYVEKIRDIKEGNKTRPSDIVKMYQKTIDIYQEFIEALSEAILALEQKEKQDKLFSNALCSITNEDLDEMNKEEQDLKKQGALEELKIIDRSMSIDGSWKGIVDYVNKKIKELEEGVEK